MSSRPRLVLRLMALGFIATMGAGMNAAAAPFGFGGDGWKEEVLLHDGAKIIVDRMVERGGRREVGQQPPIKEQRLSFDMPGSKQRVVWEDPFSQDIGTANFLPMLLDIHDAVAYLVVYPMGCLSYNKWGRPNPPYVVFRHDQKQWKRIALKDLPVDIKTPNLIFSSPDDEAKNEGQAIVSAEKIRSFYAGYRQPEFRSILREAIVNAGGEGCEKMVSDGKGGWLGIDWFTSRPDLQACLKVCTQQRIGSDSCPCKNL